MRPIGTAFVISRLGLVASALHNVQAALGHSRLGPNALAGEGQRRHINVPDIGLAVLHHIPTGENSADFSLWYLTAGTGAPPTDLLLGNLKLGPEPVSCVVLPVSLSVPRIGEKLTCVGYANMKPKDKWLPIADFAAGTINLETDTHFQLTAIEGRVTHIFTQGFARGYAFGPCVVLDCEVDHGQSGGPVFNEAGYVCGVVSAGATTFMGSKASVVGLLCPAYMTSLHGLPQAPTLRDLMWNGHIQTDGSELKLEFDTSKGSPRVDLPIHKDDAPFVYETLSEYKRGEVQQPLSLDASPRVAPVRIIGARWNL